MKNFLCFYFHYQKMEMLQKHPTLDRILLTNMYLSHLWTTRHLHPITPSFSLCTISRHHQRRQQQPVLSSTHEHHLLSLLHHHQPKRNPSTQIHSQLITTALHHHQMSETGMMLWNSLLRIYSLGPSPQEAINLYRQMHDVCTSKFPGDTFTFSFLLKACASLSHSDAGVQFHALVVKKGFEFHLYIQTALVNMYSSCRCLREAQRAFDEMPERNSVSWNAMITGFARWGELGQARLLFDQMPTRDVISWTGLIDGYTRIHRPNEAVVLFRQMAAEGIKSTEITILAVIPSISNLGALDMGETLHAYCEKRELATSDVRLKNSLIDMYAKCGSIDNSLKVFEGMHEKRNLVSWTSIISGFAMHGMANAAVRLFEKMERAKIRPNRVTFLSVLNACSHGGLVEEGLRFFDTMVYEHGIVPEIKHFGCIIDMLGRAGRLVEAEEMIIRMTMDVNVVVWRTLLGCCSKHGEMEMAERVMRRILELERRYGGDYVILSNMLTGAGRFEDAERVRSLMDERNALKVPGLSLIGGKE